MNPVVIIPSYWANTDSFGSFGEHGAYDFTTPVTRPLPELETCLESLEQVRGIIRTVVLVVASPNCADSARARVNAICRAHPNLNPLVIGGEECDTVRRTIARIVPHLDGETVSLRGYGAIKNMGLILASVFGHDTAVFLDDDDVVLDKDFLITAVYKLGTRNKQKQPVIAKTGFLLNRDGTNSPYATDAELSWSEKYWSRSAGFNQLIETNLSGPRLTRSNILAGGCAALYAQAYMNVPFDPFITRGEDFDYLLNLRARGIQVWFDNEWCVSSQPPIYTSEPQLFMQDVYRWNYELEKIAKSNEYRNLHRITPESLAPYPQDWIDKSVRTRIARTAFRRFITGPERKEYFNIWLHKRREAERWAAQSAKRYVQFATVWPHLTSTMWDLRPLQQRLLRTGTRSLGVGV